MVHQILFWGGSSVLIGLSMLLGHLQNENDIARRARASRRRIREKHQIIREARAYREAQDNKSLIPAN